jgi:hypothetical protein
MKYCGMPGDFGQPNLIAFARGEMPKFQAATYILCIDTVMPNKTSRIFNNGGSQAVSTGDVILSKKSGWSTWKEYFEIRDAAGPPKEFMAERPLKSPLTKNSLFDDD